jgi:hypothetical protein
MRNGTSTERQRKSQRLSISRIKNKNKKYYYGKDYWN